MAKAISKEGIEKIKEMWGDGFVPLANNPAIEITPTEIKVKLSKPITTEEGEITEITLKEPTVQGLMLSDTAVGEVEKTALLVSACSGVLMPYVKKIKAKDFIVLSQVVAAFLAGGL